MARTISQEKANLLASEYCTNGYNKSKALESIGYKHSYAISGGGLKTYDNIRVKQAIERIQANEKAKTDYTCDFVRQELLDLLADCKTNNDRTNRKSTLELLARHKSMLTDNVSNTSVAQPEPLTDDERQALQQMADKLTKPNTGQSETIKLRKAE